MIVSKIIIIVLLIFSCSFNIIKNGQPKSDQTYGGWGYFFAFIITVIIYYKIGVFDIINF